MNKKVALIFCLIPLAMSLMASAPITVTLMVDTNGNVIAPTNFARALITSPVGSNAISRLGFARETNSTIWGVSGDYPAISVLAADDPGNPKWRWTPNGLIGYDWPAQSIYISSSGDITTVGTISTVSSERGSQTAGPKMVSEQMIDKGNAHYYNAAGDMATDDTAALQAMLDSVRITGGKLYIPAGVYRITRPLDLTGDTSAFLSQWAVNIEGESYQSSVIIMDGFDGYPILDCSGRTKVHISNLKFVATNCVPNSYVLFSRLSNFDNGGAWCSIKHCEFHGPCAIGQIVNLSGEGVTIEDCIVSDDATSGSGALIYLASSPYTRFGTITSYYQTLNSDHIGQGLFTLRNVSAYDSGPNPSGACLFVDDAQALTVEHFFPYTESKTNQIVLRGLIETAKFDNLDQEYAGTIPYGIYLEDAEVLNMTITGHKICPIRGDDASSAYRINFDALWNWNLPGGLTNFSMYLLVDSTVQGYQDVHLNEKYEVRSPASYRNHFPGVPTTNLIGFAKSELHSGTAYVDSYPFTSAPFPIGGFPQVGPSMYVNFGTPTIAAGTNGFQIVTPNTQTNLLYVSPGYAQFSVPVLQSPTAFDAARGADPLWIGAFQGAIPGIAGSAGSLALKGGTNGIKLWDWTVRTNIADINGTNFDIKVSATFESGVNFIAATNATGTTVSGQIPIKVNGVTYYIDLKR